MGNVIELEDNYEIRFFDKKEVLISTDLDRLGDMLGLAKSIIVLEEIYKEEDYKNIKFRYNNSYSEKEEDVNGRKALPKAVVDYMETFNKHLT